MRLFEIIILLLLSLNVLIILFSNHINSRAAAGIALVCVLVLVLHLHFEGARWQMYPAYALLIGSSLWGYVFKRPKRAVGSNRAPLWIGAGVLLLLAMSVSLPLLLPVPALQNPTGTYAVGTLTVHLIDAERSDPYAPDPGERRELMIQLWYPADPSGSGENAPWMPAAEIVAPRIAEWLNLPSFFLDHLNLAESKALLEAEPLATEAPYPILLFSHGYGGFRAQNTNQAQELASHGYVIAAVEHTYGAVVTVFPDGRVAVHNPETLPEGLSDRESLVATRALGAQWAQDLQFVVDTLDEMNSGERQSRLFGLLDTTRVGAFGHSTGGGAVIEFCAHDERCDAVMTMDPFIKPVSEVSLQRGLSVPALHIFSEGWPTAENMERFRLLMASSTNDSTAVTIKGTDHYDFSDLPLLTPLAHTIGLKGPLQGRRVIEIVNRLSTQFFQRSFEGQVDAAFAVPLETYPELEPLY